MPDFEKIRREYITSTISIRELAEKYKVDEKKLRSRSQREKWMLRREQAKEARYKKSIDKFVAGATEYTDRFLNMVGKLSRKIDSALTSLPDGDIDSLRKITACMRDLRDMLGIQTALDNEEQKARIANLQRRAESDNDKSITVVFGGDTEKYAE